MNRLEFETKLYAVYGGTVTPLTSYVNECAVMVFQCTECNYKFFGKAVYMVGKKHQLHKCHKPYGDKNGERLDRVSSVNKVRKSKKKDQQAILAKINSLIWNDYTYQQIAQELKVNPNIIKDYFKSEGLIE